MTFRQVKRLVEYDFLRTEEIMANPAFLGEFVNIVGAFDWSTAAKFNLHMQSEGFPLFPFWVLSGAVLRLLGVTIVKNAPWQQEQLGVEWLCSFE